MWEGVTREARHTDVRCRRRGETVHKQVGAAAGRRVAACAAVGCNNSSTGPAVSFQARYRHFVAQDRKMQRTQQGSCVAGHEPSTPLHAHMLAGGACCREHWLASTGSNVVPSDIW